MSEDEVREVVSSISEIFSLRIPCAHNNRSKDSKLFNLKQQKIRNALKRNLMERKCKEGRCTSDLMMMKKQQVITQSDLKMEVEDLLEAIAMNTIVKIMVAMADFKEKGASREMITSEEEIIKKIIAMMITGEKTSIVVE
jgi:hypothetical protein